MSTTISLIHNVIISGRYYTAGQQIERSIVPKSMLRYEAKETRPSLPPKEINLRRQYNERYYVNAEGEMTVPARRQVAELEAQNREQDYIDEIANEPPSESVQTAIDDIREAHKADVQKQIAQAECLARHADELNDSLIQEHEAQIEAGEFNHMDVEPPPPNVVNVPKPKWQYVKRGSVFRRVKDKTIRLRADEPVFIRGSNGYEKVGTVNLKGEIE